MLTSFFKKMFFKYLTHSYLGYLRPTDLNAIGQLIATLSSYEKMNKPLAKHLCSVSEQDTSFLENPLGVACPLGTPWPSCWTEESVPQGACGSRGTFLVVLCHPLAGRFLHGGQRELKKFF